MLHLTSTDAVLVTTMTTDHFVIVNGIVIIPMMVVMTDLRGMEIITMILQVDLHGFSLRITGIWRDSCQLSSKHLKGQL